MTDNVKRVGPGRSIDSAVAGDTVQPVSVDKRDILNAITFLERAQITGGEAAALLRAQQTLATIAQALPDVPQDATGTQGDAS